MLDTGRTCTGIGLSISCKMIKTMAILLDLFPRPEPVHLLPSDATVEAVYYVQQLGNIVQDDCDLAHAKLLSLKINKLFT